VALQQGTPPRAEKDGRIIAPRPRPGGDLDESVAEVASPAYLVTRPIGAAIQDQFMLGISSCTRHSPPVVGWQSRDHNAIGQPAVLPNLIDLAR
jgi:hypothetical protein